MCRGCLCTFGIPSSPLWINTDGLNRSCTIEKVCGIVFNEQLILVVFFSDVQPPFNGSYKLAETVPDYFSGIVLQRYHLPSGIAYGTIKFQSAFNLAVVWMIVFVSLSKGLRSYGKVIRPLHYFTK